MEAVAPAEEAVEVPEPVPCPPASPDSDQKEKASDSVSDVRAKLIGLGKIFRDEQLADPFLLTWAAVALAKTVGWLRRGHALRTAKRTSWALKQRAFEPVKASAGVDGTHAMTIVTYNILADKYCMSRKHDYCPVRARQWPRRLEKLKIELLGYDADILCLQEVDRAAFFGDLGRFLKRRGYKGVYLQRAPAPLAGPHEGCAIFYKERALELEEVECKRLSDVLPAEEDNPKASNHTFWQQMYSLPDGVIIALMRHKASGKRLVCANTHLHWDPNFPHVKAMQASLVCQAIQEFRRSKGAEGCPVALCGDLNSLWRKFKSDAFDMVPPGGFRESGVFQLLSMGQLTRHHGEHPGARGWDNSLGALSAHGLSMESMWVARNGRGAPPVTTRTRDFAGGIDYIFISRGDFKVLSTLSMPYEQEREIDPENVDFESIPSGTWPSDHLAMACRVVME
mmetsp:Transcript_22597/g.70163  ORF Transcript_22597/g.70163 Transcript_22597/m.70163 type:complete len:453 (+) Transcript_22597:108-1466(+)